MRTAWSKGFPLVNGKGRPRKLGPCPYCGEDETRRLDGAVLSGVVPALLDPRCLISFGRYFLSGRHCRELTNPPAWWVCGR